MRSQRICYGPDFYERTILFLVRSYFVCIFLCISFVNTRMVLILLEWDLSVFLHNCIIFKENNEKGIMKPLFIAFFVSLVLCMNLLGWAIKLLKLSYIFFRIYFILSLASDLMDYVNSWSSMRGFTDSIIKFLISIGFVIEY